MSGIHDAGLSGGWYSLDMIRKHISPRDDCGCAIACAAMLANVSYRTAREMIVGKLKRYVNSSYYSTIQRRRVIEYTDGFDGLKSDNQLFRGMRKLGLKISPRDVLVSWEMSRIFSYGLEHDALLTLYPKYHYDTKYDDGPSHCIVWDATQHKIFEPEDVNEPLTLQDYLYECRYYVVHCIDVVGRVQR
jgi:hypothetical protein